MRKIVIVAIISLLIALVPFIINFIDNYLYSLQEQKVLISEEEASEDIGNIVVLKDKLTSSSGSDTLIVSPAIVWVPYGQEVTLTITVLFSHAQPCPYSDWKVEYSIQGNIEVVNETRGELVNSKTYVKKITLRPLGNGTVVVEFIYGSNCPYGEKEVVTATIYTGETPPSSIVEQETITTTPEESIVVEEEHEEELYNVTGYIEYIDYSRKAIVVNGTTIYIRGEWILENGTVVDKDYVLDLLDVGDYVTITYKSSNYHAEKIYFDNMVLEKS